MATGTRKAAKPTTKDEPAAVQYRALFALEGVFKYMYAWQTPLFNKLPPDDRAAFTALIESDELVEAYKGIVEDVLKAGVDLPDSWLKFMHPHVIQPDAPLAERARVMLLMALRDMQPMLLKLRVASEAKDVAGAEQPQPMPGKRQYRIKWGDLLTVHDEMKEDNEEVTDAEIVKEYTRRFKAAKTRNGTWPEGSNKEVGASILKALRNSRGQRRRAGQRVSKITK